MKKILLSFFVVMMFVAATGCGSKSGGIERLKAEGYSVENAKDNVLYSALLPMFEGFDGFQNLYIVSDGLVFVGQVWEFKSKNHIINLFGSEMENVNDYIDGNMILIPDDEEGYEDLLEIFKGK